MTEVGEPVVLRNGLGDSGGAVYTVTAQYMGAPRGGGALLNTTRRLLDELMTELALVRAVGPPLEYAVSVQSETRTIVVTLVNTDLEGGEWRGSLHFRTSGWAGASGDLPPWQLEEWTQDQRVAEGAVGVPATAPVVVPAYGVRVFALRAGETPQQ